jgi:hypothetical protein
MDSIPIVSSLPTGEPIDKLAEQEEEEEEQR